MKHRSLNNILIVSVLSLILAACGGGGTGVNILTGGTGPIDDPSIFVTTLTLVPDTISRGNPGTGTLTLTDTAGVAISGAVVQFGATSGVMDPASGAAFTDSNGIATVLVKAGAIEGSGTLSATVTVSNEVLEATPVPFLTDGDAVATLTLSISTGAGGGTSLAADDAISNEFPATVTATVIDSDGDPVQGTIVAFNLPDGFGSLSNESDITNVSGIASVVLTAGTIEGDGTVNATTTVDGQPVVSDPADDIVFHTLGDEPITGEGSTSLTIALSILDESAVALDPPNLDADTPAILSAIVTDISGDPVKNVVVQFSAELGDLFPTSGLALTDLLGVATASLNAGSVPGAGAATATVIIAGQSFDSDSLTFSTLGNAGDTAIVLALTFDDATPGIQSNIITLSEPGTLNISVEDPGGISLPNRKVSITTNLGSLQSGTSSGASIIATSDASGKITAQVLAGATIGTGNIVVTAGDTSAAVQFDVGVDGLQIGTFAGPVFTAGVLDIATSPLSAGGTTVVTVSVVDQSETVIPDIEIQFSSNCSQPDPDTGETLALVTQSATTDSSGLATATYLATGCVGNDVVSAVESSSGESATAIVDVLQSVTGSIRFDSVVVDPDDPTLTSIQIKESGGIVTAAIIFQVLDVLGAPVQDKEVSFEVTTTIGGLTLVNDTGLTDSEGKVAATVSAGFIPTTVRVRASVDVDTDNDGIDDTTLVTLSELLTVNTGIPDQNSMSVSTATFNLEGNNLDGLTTSITVRMSDFFNNPVPDGTAVSVTSELGSVAPQCTTDNGACTVTFVTQEPRSPLDPDKPFKQLGVDGCPAARINDESVTPLGTAGNTAYMVDTDDTVVVQTLTD
ncbi:MAG: hypothetical protein QGD92_05530, partial [Gammaproteobacteria bacterium]|nr:hypothetical protein [Gammaproteobacteria bacterium]